MHARGGCYTKVGLPLIENTSILEQPLDLWTLTEKYKSAATRIIENARCNTAAKELVVSTGCNSSNNITSGRIEHLPARQQWIPRVYLSTNGHFLSHRKRGQPYFLYVALAHMHVPLTPPFPMARHARDRVVYATSLREMDALIGAIKGASEDADKNNTLIWFTG